LLAGDVSLANRYLNSPFMISGFVVKGNRLGSEIGFPTANIELAEEHKLIPADGVYAVRAKRLETGEMLNGMCNIGHRPTVQGVGKTTEVNLFDFKQDIYGEHVRLYFVERIRDEQKFENLSALKVQLANDEIRSREILG